MDQFRAFLFSKASVSIAVAVVLRWTQWDVPVFSTRVVYAVCMLINALQLLLLVWTVSKAPEGRTFSARELDQSGSEIVTKQYTVREYDATIANKKLKELALSVAMTSGMHAWMKYTTPMVVACVQPLFVFFDPLFQLHVLGSKNVKVERPVQDTMTKWKMQLVEQQQKSAAKAKKLENGRVPSRNDNKTKKKQ